VAQMVQTRFDNSHHQALSDAHWDPASVRWLCTASDAIE
jgi:hypothetical protein